MDLPLPVVEREPRFHVVRLPPRHHDEGRRLEVPPLREVLRHQPVHLQGEDLPSALPTVHPWVCPSGTGRGVHVSRDR